MALAGGLLFALLLLNQEWVGGTTLKEACIICFAKPETVDKLYKKKWKNYKIS